MYKLVTYQLLAHLSIFYVIFNFNFTFFLGSLFVYFLIVSFGISATFHRMLSHRGYETSRFFKLFGLLLGTLGLNASALVWIAMHREHHANSDTMDDPHSPSFKGFIQCYFGVAMYQPKLKYAKDLLRDKDVMFFHKNYFLINIAYDVILFLINPEFVIWFHLIPAAIMWHADAAINYFAHLPTFGYRNYDTNDDSRNSQLVAFLTAGEGYHNNHHKDPKSVNFAHKKNEFDITGWFVSKIRKDKK